MDVSEMNGEVVVGVRVAPRASRDAIAGEYGGMLKVRLTAPPTEGRANEALCRLLAGRLNVPFSAVRIVSGHTSRTKRIAIAGVTQAQIAALFEASSNTRR
jgi:hypothetical protein